MESLIISDTTSIAVFTSKSYNNGKTNNTQLSSDISTLFAHFH